MEIAKHLNQGVCELTLRGEFTFADHQEFREILAKIEDKDIRQIVFNMQLVEFVDSAALGMMLLANEEAKKHHKQLIINGVTGQVKKMFEMAKFNTLFTMN